MRTRNDAQRRGPGERVSLLSLIHILVRPGEPLLPDAERSAAYEPYYRLYESLYPALKPACGRLAAL